MGWVGNIHKHDTPDIVSLTPRHYGSVWECSCGARLLWNGTYWSPEDPKNKFVLEEDLDAGV